jgi:hypothetical protein
MNKLSDNPNGHLKRVAFVEKGNAGKNDFTLLRTFKDQANSSLYVRIFKNG